MEITAVCVPARIVLSEMQTETEMVKTVRPVLQMAADPGITVAAADEPEMDSETAGMAAGQTEEMTVVKDAIRAAVVTVITEDLTGMQIPGAAASLMQEETQMEHAVVIAETVEDVRRTVIVTEEMTGMADVFRTGPDPEITEEMIVRQTEMMTAEERKTAAAAAVLYQRQTWA